MDEILFGATMLAVGLLMWAAVGHAIWMVGVRIVVAMLGTRCQRCGRKSLSEGNCPYCVNRSASPVTTAPTVQDDLTAARRLLQFAKFKHWLNEAEHHSLASSLERLSQRLSSDPTALSTAAATKPAEKAAVKSGQAPPIPELSQSGSERTTQPVATSPHSGHEEPVLVNPPAVTRVTSVGLQQPTTAFAANIHPLDAVDEPSTVRETRPPIAQRLTTELLKSFMEQSNIRWIELISASLIVVCSVGLVISLWSTLSNTSRFFPSLVFLLATAAVHGAGQYTLRQWKLRATSRGILHIGLMLIPLAVLVGILLARREDQPPSLDTLTVIASVSGIAVYGCLAVTACRALFSRRWWLVASVSVISSVTLLPIYYLAQKSSLSDAAASLILLPMLLASMWAALMTSLSITRRTKLTSGLAKRVAGIVTQCCFAAGVVLVFWIIESRDGGGLSGTWWLAMGLLSAAWASWGWATSLGDLHRLSFSLSTLVKPPAQRQRDVSWLRVAAWCWTWVCSSLLLAALWQTAANRWAACGLLGAVAAWWLVQGWVCRLQISLLAGALMALLSFTLGSETLYASSVALHWADWLSLNRIATLSGSGLLMLGTGWWLTFCKRPAKSDASHVLLPLAAKRRLSLTISQCGWQFAIAGGLAVAGSAVLTIVSSLVPWGPTPYGGNWASLLLMGYGLTASLGSVLIAGSKSDNAPRLSWLMPAGQAVLLLGFIRLCQTSPVLDPWLASLRPERAWAVGTVVLAVIWTLAAASLTSFTGRTAAVATVAATSGRQTRLSVFDYLSPLQRLNIHWLCGGGLALALVGIPAVWNRSEYFHLAAWMGWYLPLTFWSIFIAWRHSLLREIGLLSLCCWLTTLLYFTGYQQAWWSSLPLATSCAIFSLLIVFTVFLYELAVEHLRLPEPASNTTPHTTVPRSKTQRPEKSPQSPQLDAPTVNWAAAGPHWASPMLLALCWVMAWVTLAPLVAAELNNSLGQTVSSQVGTPKLIGGVGALVLLVQGAALTAVGCWLGLVRREWWLVSMGALLPVWTAMVAAGYSSPPYALTAGLWVLSIWIVTSELMRFHRSGAQYSVTAWRQLIYQNANLTQAQLWLPLARAVAVGLLLVGTATFVAAAYVGRMPAELVFSGSSWSSNAALTLLMLGPATLVMLVRWLLSVVGGEAARMTTVSGILLATLAGCAGSLAVIPSWPSSAIVFLQVAGLVAAVLAWNNLVFSTWRNLLGLKRLAADRVTWQELLPKATKGNRWKQSELASWYLIQCALSAVLVLCLGAAVVSIAYPAAILPGLPRLGGALSLLTFVVTFTLYYLQSTRRGVSRFGLLAMALGVSAPLASAAYAQWLISNPSQSLAAAQDFEPFRLLVVLWLVALAIGLTVRIVSLRQAQVISVAGEAAWVALAAIVAGLGLVSILQDPNPLWPLAELSALALIGVLSSLASGQAWRGHLAAVAAAAGLCGWLLLSSGRHGIDVLWLLLWGPTWVASVALLVQLFYPRLTRKEDRQASLQQTGSRGNRAFTALRFTSVDQSVSLHVPLVTMLLSCFWIAMQPATVQAPGYPTWWKLILAICLLALACGRLWDVRSGKRGLSVYLSLLSLSLVAAVCLCSLGQLPRLQTWLLWLASGLGAMAIMAALLRELVRESSRLGPALRLHAIMGDTEKLRHALTWMPALHSAVGLVVLVPSILLALAFDGRELRLAATALPFIGAMAILPIAIERGKVVHRYCGLLLISTAVLLVWWADLPSVWAGAAEQVSWIYLQRAFVGLVALGLAYAAVVVTLRGNREWEAPLMNCGWIALWLGLASGITLLVLQLDAGWETQAASATLVTKLLTIAAWSAAVTRLLQFAVRPHSTDQTASVGLRQASVYAAQIELALLCAAFYFHFPNLFSGVLARWWPLVVFAIAMLSAGLGHWLERLGQTIVADPVRQSSLLLPLIPLAGVWWIQPEGAAWLWQEWSRYWLLLLTAASLYGLHGWMQQSRALRGLSAGLALLAFWAFLHSQPNLRFLEHPQFWLLPPALATLIFVELNRSQLEEKVVSGTRYLAVLIAYFSSTAEIFLKAFEGQLWQPLLLLVLALLGVAAGIFLHVRAFLYCGMAFTVIALLGMVWHAQQAIGQVWPWWAFGICTGIGLIAVLGYFEKNRSQVLVYLEQLKSWEQ